MASSTNEIKVEVSDGEASTTNSFVVVVDPLVAFLRLTLQSIPGNSQPVLEIFASNGLELILETSTSLLSWDEVETLRGRGQEVPLQRTLPPLTEFRTRFFRVRSK